MKRITIAMDLSDTAVREAINLLGAIAFERRLLLIVPAQCAAYARDVAVNVSGHADFLISVIVVPNELWREPRGWMLAVDGSQSAWSEGC